MGSTGRSGKGRQQWQQRENMDGEPPSQVFAMTTGPVSHFNELPHTTVTVNKQGWLWSPQCAATPGPPAAAKDTTGHACTATH